MKTTVLGIHYFPCIAWFRYFLAGNTILDQHEHYSRQTYRNRAMILSANGPLALTVPVKKDEGKQAMQQIRIEYDFNWQKQHWETIRSAYGSAPYFMHYGDKVRAVIADRYERLMDLDLASVNACLELLKVSNSFVLSTSYEIPDDVEDLRESFHPKKAFDGASQSYYQVFSEKMAFIPNLSILDLLFNKGPDSISFLI